MRFITLILTAFFLTVACLAQTVSLNDQLTAVRQLAAIGVYLSRCPTLVAGPSLNSIGLSKGILPSDLAEGGRFRSVAQDHAKAMAAVGDLAGGNSSKSVCDRALSQYGPAGYVVRGAIVERPR